MLSRLMRGLLLGQILIGALLGWLLAWQTGATLWLVAVMALALPLIGVLLVIITIALLSRAPGANSRWLRSLLFEYAAMLRASVWQLPWASIAQVAMPVPGATMRTPVLLVHGYLCNHRVWDAMAHQLQSAGHPVMQIDLEPVFAPIDSYAPQVEQAVLELCHQTGATKVALIGHSMGGVVIRAWMRAFGTTRVDRVITLGTPHAGTQIARRTRTPNGQQMVWRSAWLQELERSESPQTRALMRIALTPQDHIVFPQREQVLPGVPVTVFDGLGHLELCRNRAVIAWVLQQLDDPVVPA
ncbi:MAG: alpha/beta fold hydrolase [Gammaproteobacteria bacterium]|uniref:esterase/lipase family protein n=1 Tax=Rhodoferax sp. TaxID=50421 RepID=UPI0017BFB3AB|nr:alpha/beta fold hydrolase [Rhodoferax sp.]MBU3899752.1 alpha/beta fold hydrolase [Gammaproteobacteria bacterium]MBA3057971.1 alpha/beta fold hydrolase [Rhodoferax sp.]MBU3997383.1 alpha/beta fold hydrolase [Gammaproteobacteria bacterium]MBU4018228.1 alpha/beta fold hydrolase [Gammaproteobacteria bacterium]MBU4080081.1 alpha/beta fold hydrolase [Gammaproteobacteria bacterium]